MDFELVSAEEITALERPKARNGKFGNRHQKQVHQTLRKKWQRKTNDIVIVSKRSNKKREKAILQRCQKKKKKIK
ncbi:hypothetical protein LOS20_15990 [Enterococcus faecium]|nr:hypothetical protein [Enterococcus faecium]